MTEETDAPRAPQLELESAIAIADACTATNFPPPPHVQAMIDAAGAAQVKATRRTMDVRRKAAEAEAAKAAEAEAPAQPLADAQTPSSPIPGADQPKE